MIIDIKSFNNEERKMFLWIFFTFILFLIFRITSKQYYLIDSYEYLQAANQISDFSVSDTKRPFFYPLFLSFFLNVSTSIILVVQTFFGLLTFYFFFKILKSYNIEFKRKYFWFLIFTPSIFIYTQLIMSEWLVMLLLTILLWLLIQDWSVKIFAYIQIITLLLAFTKPVFYPFIYINFLFFSFYLIKKRIFSLWLFIPILVLQLYLTFNEYKTGYRHFSSIENINLINYNLYYFKSSTESKEKADLWLNSVYNDSFYENKNFKEQNVYLKEIAMKEIKQNLLKYCSYHFFTSIRGVFDPGRFDLMTFFRKEDGKQGFLEILNSDKSIFSLFKNQFAFVYLLLIPIFLFNLVKWHYFFKCLIFNKLNFLSYYILVLLIYSILVSGPVNCSRYMMPFQIIVIFFGILGYLIESQKKSKIN